MVDLDASDYDDLIGISATQPKRTRERSTIEFPYSDLESIVNMVATLHSKAGTECEDVQLASWLNQTASGGGFRSRLSAGRMFGLIETSGSMVRMTPLGFDVLDGDRKQAARAESFLRVPLYREMYEKYKGYSLPPAPAIEMQMEALGVASKQKDRARQTFMKSANYAGYIDSQTGRLTKPAFVANALPTQREEEIPPAERAAPPKPDSVVTGENSNSSLPQGLHPFIVGLLHELPPAKSSWSVEKRVDWLTAAATMFKLIYSGEGVIAVSSDNGSSSAKHTLTRDNGD